MSTCVVQACGRPTQDLACRTCVDRLLTDLRAVPELLRELVVTETRQDRIASEQYGRSAETALVWREHASESLWVLRNTLSAWARDLAGANGSSLDVATDPASVSAWFLRHPSWIANYPFADELLDEIEYAVRQVRRAIDTPQDLRVYLGRCDLGLEENPPCSRELFAHRHQEKVPCPACGAEWDVAERRQWLLALAEDETATVEALAGLLSRLGVEVTVGQILGYARKRMLIAASQDAHRKCKYRVGDVLDVVLSRNVVAS